MRGVSRRRENVPPGRNRPARCRGKDCSERSPDSVPRVAGSFQAGNGSSCFLSVKAHSALRLVGNSLWEAGPGRIQENQVGDPLGIQVRWSRKMVENKGTVTDGHALRREDGPGVAGL